LNAQPDIAKHDNDPGPHTPRASRVFASSEIIDIRIVTTDILETMYEFTGRTMLIGCRKLNGRRDGTLQTPVGNMDSLGLVVHFTLLTLRDEIPPSAYGACQVCSSIVTATFDG